MSPHQEEAPVRSNTAIAGSDIDRGNEGLQLADLRGFRLAEGCDGRQQWRHRLVQPRM
jgi:hypothetical protein